MLFCGFSTFQSRNAQLLIFSASILINLTHFPDGSETLLYEFKKNSENLSRVGALGRRYPCYPNRAKIHRLGMGGQESNRQSLKSQEDKALFHQVKSHVFCVIEFKKRSHLIAQDIFLFLLWTSDPLPVQSGCFAHDMISLLRKAMITFQEPVVIATTSNKLDIDRG